MLRTTPTVHAQPAAAQRAELELAALLAARSLVDQMRNLYRELERLTDAPIAMHRALTFIADNPGLTASNLASNLGMQRPAVSHILKGMTKRGWIERERHHADQRSVRLHVTAVGRKVLADTAGRAVGTLRRAVRTLSRDQLQGLIAGLNALLAKLPPAQTGAGPPRAKRRPPA